MNLTIKEEWYRVAESIQDLAQKASFYEILTRYFFDGAEPEENGSPALIMFKLIKKEIDRDKAEKEARRERQTARKKPKADKKATATRPTADQTPTEQKQAAKKTQKPTVEEIADHIKEKGYGVNARQFFNYYEANGWRVGRNPMKNWKAAVENWATNSFENRKADGTVWQKEHEAADDYLDKI